MNWVQILGIAISTITIIGFLYAFFNRLDADIKGVKDDLKGWTLHLTAMQAEQAKRAYTLHQRTDKLYEMFYELLKQGKK